ncbi:MAG: flagellar biosynthesis protein FlhF [Treponema sp.]|jgi:flagellar biosynthesis protein FlhF|nr:flagellar biosynthesis protein FlhF [Treponema sp.]
MEQFVEQGASYAECVQKARIKYGDRARVMDYRTIRIGGIFGGLFSREGVEITGYVSPTLSYAAVGGYGGSSGIVLPARQSPQAVQSNPTDQVGQTLDFEEEKKKLLAVTASAKQPAITLQKLFNEVRALTEKIDANMHPLRGPPEEEHPTLQRLEELFYQNDFSPGYTKTMLNRVRKEFSLDALEDYDAVQDKALAWIGETLRIHAGPPVAVQALPRRKPRILALVGPTGVGKTTTIAKMAAAFGVDGWGRPPLKVVMITIDGYRIAAREQLEKYGSIMEIPVSYVSDEQELRKTIAFYQDAADLILVDTIGKNPRDAVELGKMKQFLDACGSSAEVHLAMAASTKYSDIREILRQFAPFNYRAVVITKLDETIRVGNVISALFTDGKEVSYITDGQPVDKHIHRASVVRFLINLEGFRIDREEIEAMFPSTGEK